MSGDFRLRLGGADDVTAMVDLHLESFGPEEHVAVLLGPRYLAQTYLGLVASEGSFVMVAERGHRVVGILGVSRVRATRGRRLARLGAFARALIARPRLLLSRQLWARVAGERSSTPALLDRGDIARGAIGAVAVGERRRGVWLKLLAAATLESRRRGYRGFAAGMYAANTAIRRSVERQGWLLCPGESETLVWYCCPFDEELRHALQAAPP